MFFFSKDNDLTFKSGGIEHAYLAILNNDLESALRIFGINDSPRAKWGVSLVEILKGFLEFRPTYFEIRNFLEIDLDFLIKNQKIEYIEMLLGALDLLAGINQEVYKYTARVMYENKYYNVAKEYLEKSKNIFYRDPELHFMLAKYYIKSSDYEQADFYLEECLKTLPDYYPAKMLKKEIAGYLA